MVAMTGNRPARMPVRIAVLWPLFVGMAQIAQRAVAARPARRSRPACRRRWRHRRRSPRQAARPAPRAYVSSTSGPMLPASLWAGITTDIRMLLSSPPLALSRLSSVTHIERCADPRGSSLYGAAGAGRDWPHCSAAKQRTWRHRSMTIGDRQPRRSGRGSTRHADRRPTAPLRHRRRRWRSASSPLADQLHRPLLRRGAILELEPRTGARLLFEAADDRLAHSWRHRSLRHGRRRASGCRRRSSTRVTAIFIFFAGGGLYDRLTGFWAADPLRHAARRLAVVGDHLHRRAAAHRLGGGAVFLCRDPGTAGHHRAALGLGVAIGLGLLSKYAMAFFAIGIVMHVVLVPSAWRILISRHLHLALIVAALIIAPNLWWNRRTASPPSPTPPTTPTGRSTRCTGARRWSSSPPSSACSARSCSPV